MSKKMAYLMQVNWNWIKQRPHFIAEKLSEYFELDLFYVKSFRKKGLVNNEVKCNFNSMKSFVKLPYSQISKEVKWIEKRLNRSLMKRLYKSKYYDYYYITCPRLLQFFDITKISGGKIIYDCMDDIIELTSSEKDKNSVYLLEQELLKYADIVLVSSLKLQDVIRGRGYKRKICLVNNGIEPKSLIVSGNIKLNLEEEKGLFNIYYIGTISKWFDFDLILKLLCIHEDIMFSLIGPVFTTTPKHERIRYMGTVEHDEIAQYAIKADAFIMPFVRNDLVLAVDPVKVYEYIAFMKPTFVLKYDETVKFKDFVYLYNDLEDLSKQITAVKGGNFILTPKENIDHFMQENSWSSRAEYIYNNL